MLQAAALKLLIPQDVLQLHRGRCLRHRLSSSGCNRCLETCTAGALSWTDTGLVWNENKCTSCLLCVAACPTDALTCTRLTLSDLLPEMNDVEAPLLGCSLKPHTRGHVRVPCLGLLADTELLLVLQLALGKEIRLNLSACGDCENGRIAPELLKTMTKVETLTRGLPGGLRPIYTPDLLNFQEKTLSRRDFFIFLNRRSKQKGLSLVDRLRFSDEPGKYGKKSLPKARQLILQLVAALPAAQRDMLSDQLFPELKITAQCTGCTACVGICPTGALTRPGTRGCAPDVNTERCTACALCTEFCRQQAIQVPQHHSDPL